MLQANSVFIIIFALIAMGYLIKKYNYITEKEGKVISKLLMHTTFPALMIISTINVKLQFDLMLIPMVCVLLGGFTVSVAWWLFKDKPTKLRGILMMGTGGLNVGLFGFPLIEGIWGSKALLYAVMFDIGNTFMTFVVVYSLGVYFSDRGENKINLKKIMKRIVFLPPVTGMLIGLAINFSGIKLPIIAFDFLEVLAKSNKALVLILMGLYLNFELNKSQVKDITKVLFIRYFYGLLFCFTFYFSLDPSLMRNVLMVLVILPLGMTILPFSDEFDFDSQIAGTLINVSLLASFVIIWILVLALDLLKV